MGLVSLAQDKLCLAASEEALPKAVQLLVDRGQRLPEELVDRPIDLGNGGLQRGGGGVEVLCLIRQEAMAFREGFVFFEGGHIDGAHRRHLLSELFYFLLEHLRILRGISPLEKLLEYIPLGCFLLHAFLKHRTLRAEGCPPCGDRGQLLLEVGEIFSHDLQSLFMGEEGVPVLIPFPLKLLEVLGLVGLLPTQGPEGSLESADLLGEPGLPGPGLFLLLADLDLACAFPRQISLQALHRAAQGLFPFLEGR